MNKAIFILGPTASGKTNLSLKIAEKFDGEVVNIDSQQAIKYLNIGTDKIKKRQMQGIPHHMLDIYLPSDNPNAYDFCVEAEKVIRSILKRGNLPVIVGGTGLYARILSGEWSLRKEKTDQNRRTKLEKLSLGALQKLAEKVNRNVFDELNDSDRKNKRRLIRLIEQFYTTKGLRVRFLNNVIILKLCRRLSGINEESIRMRVKTMIKSGLIEETTKILKKFPSFEKNIKALGYKEVQDYLKGIIGSKRELADLITSHTKQYARRQLTWLKKEKNLVYFDTDGEAIDLVKNFLKS